MPAACDYFNFIWIGIFYASFSSPEMTIYEFEQNQLAVIILAYLSFNVLFVFTF